MLTRLCTAFAFATIVRRCSPTFDACASACLGCALANPTNKLSELVYHFPIDTPFRVLFIDGYSAGHQSSFEGDKTYLIVCCGMMGFAIMEPVKHATSATFASALMKILL